MPNYFAHITFGRQVLSELPLTLRETVERERPAFELGCLGPDILFFYHPATRNPARMEGKEMHKHSALPAFQRLRTAVEKNVPMSRGYAAGFLCHLALDNACHPYVTAKAAQGEITHLAVEAEFDRLLMERAGLPVRRRTHMPPPAGEAVYQAAALAYGQAKPAEIRKGFLAMRRDTKLLACFYGTRIGRLADRVCRRLKSLEGASGVVLDAKPAPACVESNRALLTLLERTAPAAAEQTRRFFAAIGTGASLDTWLDRDFEGTVYLEQEKKAGSVPLP